MQLRRDWWACLDSSLNKNLAIHIHRTTFVGVFQRSSSCCQLVLVLGRSDDTGLSRTYVPTNRGDPTSAQGATLQSVLVGALFSECVVTCRQVAGHNTDTLCAV